MKYRYSKLNVPSTGILNGIGIPHQAIIYYNFNYQFKLKLFVSKNFNFINILTLSIVLKQS